MPKKRLNKKSRHLIYHYMYSQAQLSINKENQLTEKKSTAVAAINEWINSEYPLSDMKVLKKYNLTTFDTCMRFCNDGNSSEVYSLYCNEECLLPVPQYSGCKIRAGTESLKTTILLYKEAEDKSEKELHAKASDYYSFVNTCTYVEDVEQVVPLTEEIRLKIYGQNTAIALINPEIISKIKADFAPAK